MSGVAGGRLRPAGLRKSQAAAGHSSLRTRRRKVCSSTRRRRRQSTTTGPQDKRSMKVVKEGASPHSAPQHYNTVSQHNTQQYNYTSVWEHSYHTTSQGVIRHSSTSLPRATQHNRDTRSGSISRHPQHHRDTYYGSISHITAENG